MLKSSSCNIGVRISGLCISGFLQRHVTDIWGRIYNNIYNNIAGCIIVQIVIVDNKINHKSYTFISI